MKKIFTLIMIFSAFALVLAGCGSDTASNTKSSSSAQDTRQAATSGKESSDTNVLGSKAGASQAKALIVYYSWSGNTRQVANEIQKQTGADIFEITPEKPYSKDYDTVVNLAKEEKNKNARPAISGKVDHLENYDVVFVGYPNWWSDMPMLMYTFFESYDLSGKKIVPFCTSGGGGFANSIDSIQSLEPNADILEGLHVSGSEASGSQNAVAAWLGKIGFAK